jgi:membrane-associated phospholipid phosphatase
VSGWSPRVDETPAPYGGPVDRLIVLLVVALWGAFAALTVVVWGAEGAIGPAELQAAETVHEWATANAWAIGVSRLFDVIGGGLVCTLVVVIASLVLVMAGARHRPFGPRSRALALLVASALGGVVINSLVKAMVDRPRPPWNGAWLVETSTSYPSGHAQAGITVWFALGVVILIADAGRWTWLLATPLLILGPLIGASRTVVGVHWPTDVLGGWLLGAAWLGTCVVVLRRVRGRAAAAGQSRR